MNLNIVAITEATTVAATTMGGFIKNCDNNGQFKRMVGGTFVVKNGYQHHAVAEPKFCLYICCQFLFVNNIKNHNFVSYYDLVRERLYSCQYKIRIEAQTYGTLFDAVRYLWEANPASLTLIITILIQF